MIRAVFDTNVVISGMLWSGTPSLVLQAAVNGQLRLLASEELLDELREVLDRPKFSARLQLLRKTASQVVESYIALVEVIEAEPIERIVPADADDDHVLACASSGHAGYIVSGDPHLLEIRQYRDMLILSASDFIAVLDDERHEDQSVDDL